MSTNKLIPPLGKCPIQEYSNAIYLTLYRNCKYNVYAETEPVNITNNIWSVASDWNSLITKLKRRKQIML